jgi:hypothetical protein
MDSDEFNELLAGPLDHPLIPMQIARLVLALKAVVDATGEAGERALLAHCVARQEQDESEAREEGMWP